MNLQPLFNFKFCLLSSVALLTVSCGNTWAFSFVGADFVDINTGFDLGFSVPDKDTAPRWDAQDFTLGSGSIFNSRSLDGGLTYNYEAGFLNSFTWAGTAPTQAQLDTAIATAFDVWHSGSPLSFVKVNTAAVLTGRNGSGNNIQGADIDLFARNLGGSGGIGSFAETAAYAIRQSDGGNVILTSGPLEYPSSTIAASDIRMNTTEAGNAWTLDDWRTVLTHEIGHSLGLGDVEVRPFWDTDNTINNVMTIDPNDPNNSPGLANRGTKTATQTANILMRSQFTGLTALQSDDLAGRFFLYPVPEPSVGAFLAMGALFLLRRKIRPSA